MLKILKRPGVSPLTAALFAAGALTGASQVWATTTAATSTVRNVVTVAYSNSAGTAQTPLTAAVDVTVNLVKAAATLSAPVDITTDPATAAVYSYTITNGANGISTYTPSTSVTAQANITGSTVSTPAAITLGATTVTTGVTIAAAGTTVITVPRDNLADTSVNGIAAGDTVVIGGAVYTVSAVSDVQVPVSPSTLVTTTITVSGNGTLQTVTAGTLIAERKTFTVSVTPGTTTSTTDGTIDVTLSVTDGTNVSTDSSTTTVAAVGLTVTKLVRNTNYAAGVGGNTAGTGSTTYNSVVYYTGGVTGNPGEVLEYLIVVSKGSSAGIAKFVKVSDPIPVFTLYQVGTLFVDTTGVGTGFVAATDAADADAGETDGTTSVYFYPGAGRGGAAGGFGGGTGGSMATSTTSLMKFQVKIQ